MIEVLRDGKSNEEMDLLLLAWLTRFCEDAFGVSSQSLSGSGSGAEWSRTLTLSDGSTVDTRSEARKLAISTSDASKESKLAEIVAQALERVEARDRGADVWWSTSYTSASFGLGAEMLTVHGLRALEERCLPPSEVGVDQWAYLNVQRVFADPDAADPINAGGTLAIEATFRTPGPSHSELSQRLAAELAGWLGSALCFATGLQIRGGLVFAAGEHEGGVALARLSEGEGVPELCFQHRDRQETTALWPAIARWGASDDLGSRIRGFLASYEAALAQNHGETALGFLVGAMEALSTPPQPWRTERVVHRFVRFFEELLEPSLQRVMAIQDFSQAFGNLRTPRSFLNKLYASRSSTFHGALAPAAAELMDTKSMIRVARTAALARDGFGAFIEAPRSSLLGHPVIGH